MATKTKARTPARRSSRRRVPIAELRDWVLGWRREEGYHDETIRQDRQNFRVLEERLGVKWADELEDPDVIRRLDDTIESRNLHTRRSRLATLQSSLNRAARCGRLRSVPRFPDVVRLQTPKMPKAARSRPPAPASADGTLAYLAERAPESRDDARLHALVATVCWAGVGLTQAIRLRVRDVDLAARTMRLTGTRTRRERDGAPTTLIRLDPRLVAILSRWVPLAESAWLFPNARRTGPFRKREALAALKAAAHAARAKGVTFESLRRYFLETAALMIPAEPEPPAAPPEPTHTIRLGGPGEPTYIDGRRVKKPLTKKQHALVSALLEAGRDGLTADEFPAKTQQGGWRQTLLKLKRSDRLWDAIIVFPGPAHGAYRLAAKAAAAA
jgi:integrase